MKIILKAFNLKSEIMEIPDNSTRIWKMPLYQGEVDVVGHLGDSIGEIKSIDAIGEFEFTGKFHLLDNGESVSIYVLKDIIKK